MCEGNFPFCLFCNFLLIGENEVKNGSGDSEQRKKKSKQDKKTNETGKTVSLHTDMKQL